MTLWKDYDDNSQLTLVFGYVSAKVQQLSTPDDVWGITTQPYTAWTFHGTRAQAKQEAERFLVRVITEAAQGLGYKLTQPR